MLLTSNGALDSIPFTSETSHARTAESTLGTIAATTVAITAALSRNERNARRVNFHIALRAFTVAIGFLFPRLITLAVALNKTLFAALRRLVLAYRFITADARLLPLAVRAARIRRTAEIARPRVAARPTSTTARTTSTATAASATARPTSAACSTRATRTAVISATVTGTTTIARFTTAITIPRLRRSPRAFTAGFLGHAIVFCYTLAVLFIGHIKAGNNQQFTTGLAEIPALRIANVSHAPFATCLAFITLFAYPIDSRFTLRAWRFFHALTINTDFVRLTVVRNTDAEFFVLACWTWIYLAAIAATVAIFILMACRDARTANFIKARITRTR